MALGDTYNNNKGDKKNNDPNLYSNYKMSNVEGIDPSALSFTFCLGGLLKISISPKKNNSNGDISFDHENAIAIYLTHIKARLLAEEIEEFKKGKINNAGIDTNTGFISISNGKELGINNICMIIRKFDDTGTVSSSYAYEFKKNYHYAVRNFEEKTSKFDKNYYDNLEIDQFQTLLVEYYKSMTGAIAYSVIDQSKYNNSRVHTKLDSIATKLGIEYTSGNGGSKGGGKSFFSEKEPRDFTSATMNDLDNIM